MIRRSGKKKNKFKKSKQQIIVEYLRTIAVSFAFALFVTILLSFHARSEMIKNLYVDAEEREKVPEEFIWRTDILEVDSYDFEYLREWRIKGNVFDFSEISFEDILVIAPDLEHLNDLVVKYDWIFKYFL